MVQQPTVVVDGFQEVKRKKKVSQQQKGVHLNNQKPKMVYRPISKPTTNTGGANTSKVPFISTNPYELLSDYGTIANDPVCVEVKGMEDLKKTGYSGGSKIHQLAEDTDDFDIDVDEHIEISEEASVC